jgi:hypothetical protein
MLRDDITPYRLQIPRYEQNHPWLHLLLDCYAVIDFSTAASISQSKKIPACYKGCSFCCNQNIPISIIESVGIKFYIDNILHKPTYSQLINNFNEHNKACLFNIDNCCIIYPMRPISCRRYIITSQCCSFNEDPFLSRPDDVLEPSRDYLYQAVEITLPFYNLQGIYIDNSEDVFNFYKKQSIILSSIYDILLNIH